MSAGVETDPGNNIEFFNTNPLVPKMQRWQSEMQRELPFDRGRRHMRGMNRVADGFLGGWQLQTAYVCQTGAPLTWSALNVVFNGNHSDITTGERSVGEWFNIDGFPKDSTKAPHSTHQLAAWPMRLSSVRQDFINNWDMSLIRNSKIRETAEIKFRAGFLNAINHASFRARATKSYNRDFGQVTDTANSPRQIQIGAKPVF